MTNNSADNPAETNYLGVSVDESFAEFSLLGKSRKPLRSRRIYLPRENLKNSLVSFLQEGPLPSEIYVSLRFLEKILDYRLGGSVAQLVSEGFENWAQIRSRRPGQQNLSNPDLVFAVQERVSAQGEVLQELNIEDLEIIEAKLKMMEVKRVCLHFLHSTRQPHNLRKAREFFEQRGFDVFAPPASENPDEVSRWRANTLNASISGTFLELKEQIAEACRDLVAAEKIFFLSARKKLFQEEKQARLGSLFSTRTAIMDAHKERGLLYLGLEKFSWISARMESFWESPWGRVELDHSACVDIPVQPTSLIDLNIFGELDFSTRIERYEPGPMCLGRGQKPTFLDLFAEDENLRRLPGIGERLAPNGVQRFKSTLMALAKSGAAPGSAAPEVSALVRRLQESALQKIALQVNLQAPVTVKMVGPLAGVLGPGLKKLFPDWQLDPENFEDSLAVAFAGRAWENFREVNG